MKKLGRFISQFRRLEDLSASIQDHLEEKIEDLIESGMSREEAYFVARREFGNLTQIEEHSREVWGWQHIENLFADLKIAWRQFRKHPRFTSAAIATLAVGIGAQGTIYSVVHAVLINLFLNRGAVRMVHLHLYEKSPFPRDLALTGPQFSEFQKLAVIDGAVAEDRFSRDGRESAHWDRDASGWLNLVAVSFAG